MPVACLFAASTLRQLRFLLSGLLLPSFLLLLLQACASAPATTVIQGPDLAHPHALFGTRPADIPTPEQLFALDPAQQAELDAFLAAAPGRPRFQRLADYAERITRGFNYQEVTLSARDALELQRGNCLTLAILTTGLARYAGVGISYQLVNDTPVYQFGGSMVLKGVHVRSLLFDSTAATPTDSLLITQPGVIVDYFPSGKERFIGNLGEAEFIASYYRNRAADLLQSGERNQAWWYAQEAFSYGQQDPESINLLAVIGRQAGDAAYAERMYHYGIDLARNKLSLLKNYRILLLAQERFEEARQIELRLARMEDPSPFHWFLLAQEALDDGEVEDALRYYRRALALAPYLHEANLGMAQANARAGRLDAAREQLLEALGKVQRASTRHSYKAKLLNLERGLAADQ